MLERSNHNKDHREDRNVEEFIHPQPWDNRPWDDFIGSGRQGVQHFFLGSVKYR